MKETDNSWSLPIRHRRNIWKGLNTRVWNKTKKWYGFGTVVIGAPKPPFLRRLRVHFLVRVTPTYLGEHRVSKHVCLGEQWRVEIQEYKEKNGTAPTHIQCRSVPCSSVKKWCGTRISPMPVHTFVLLYYTYHLWKSRSSPSYCWFIKSTTVGHGRGTAEHHYWYNYSRKTSLTNSCSLRGSQSS